MSSGDSERLAIGQRIRSLRTTKGITGQKLAQLSMISPAYLSEVERGQSEISGVKLARIAVSLGVNLQALIEGGIADVSDSNAVIVPAALSQVAEELNLSYQDTLRILDANRSLVARRSSGKQEEWDVQKWKEFYEKMKPFLED